MTTVPAGGGTTAEPALDAFAGLDQDPVTTLVERVGPPLSRAVDPLQLAAMLEAEGVTDHTARVQYGCADVFALAEEVWHRTGEGAQLLGAPPRARGDRTRAVRDVSHGLMYLLPAAAFPAALALLGQRSMVLGLLITGGLGWVVAGGASWLAYRVLGCGCPGAAALVLRWAALAALPLGAGVGLAIASATSAAHALPAVALGQIALQMSGTLLMFYRSEIWLFATMAPAVVAGFAYLLGGPRLLGPALAVISASVAAAFVVALRRTAGRAGPDERWPRETVHGELSRLPWVLLYSALSAGYLLTAQGRLALGGADVAFALVPLLLVMGVVEWRARRFGEGARALPARVRYPSRFVLGIWLMVARDLGICLVAGAVLAAGLLAGLDDRYEVTEATTLVATAGVLLGGAYFLGFLLANLDCYEVLCAALLAGLTVQVGFVLAEPLGVGPLAADAALLSSAALLLLLFLVALAGRVDQARYHR